ncbi:hypothetical protein OBV_28080 [Oscillibacter valericigenes Sjm18-20]|nr:hypothetical protein OBV_28080 [Oscillibacter valericigenes Sjm18-20]
MSALGRETLVAADDTWTLMVILCAGVAFSIWLEQKYNWASKISGAIIALIIAMVLANVGVIPTSCPLYDNIVWGMVVPMGIPLLLLQCNIKKIWKETGRMLTIFLIGAVGTVVGAFLAYFLLRNPFGDAQGLAKVAAMMTGSYIGGGVNFAAMASQYAAGDDLTAAATVADNLLMAAYFFVLIAFAGMKFFRRNYRHPLIDEVESGTTNRDAAQTQAAAFWSRKDISLKDIAINFAYCIAIVWFSKLVAGGIAGLVPENPSVFHTFDSLGVFGTVLGTVLNVLIDFIGKFFGSQYVWITTFSVIVATFMDKQVAKLHGSQEIGTYLIYLFLFVIGVPANIYTVVTKSPLLLVLTAIMVIVNMLFCFIAAKLFHFDLEDAIIASNANIGGPTTAAGMAISQGWAKLVGPAMLIGTLGYVIGNYLGTVVGIVLGA